MIIHNPVSSRSARIFYLYLHFCEVCLPLNLYTISVIWSESHRTDFVVGCSQGEESKSYTVNRVCLLEIEPFTYWSEWFHLSRQFIGHRKDWCFWKMFNFFSHFVWSVAFPFRVTFGLWKIKATPCQINLSSRMFILTRDL